jgi:hypothetical protein
MADGPGSVHGNWGTKQLWDVLQLLQSEQLGDRDPEKVLIFELNKKQNA